MSSPADTVDQVFQWLRKVFGVFLPTLPLATAYRRFTSLFGISIAAPLPAPDAPLPWDVPLAEDWPLPMPGVDVALQHIRIHVAERADGPATVSPSFPPTEATKE